MSTDKKSSAVKDDPFSRNHPDDDALDSDHPLLKKGAMSEFQRRRFRVLTGGTEVQVEKLVAARCRALYVPPSGFDRFGNQAAEEKPKKKLLPKA